MKFFFIAVQCFFKIKGLNQPLDFMFTCPNYEIATYIVKYKSAQSCKSKVTGSVSLRCWPEVLLCGVAERAGYDIKRSNPLSSAMTLSSEGLVLRHSWPRAPRNLRSIAHRTGETVAKLPLTLRMHSRFTQTRSICRTDGPRAATFLQNVAFFPSHFNEKRSSPLISAGVLSSEGLCCSHLALCAS